MTPEEQIVALAEAHVELADVRVRMERLAEQIRDSLPPGVADR